MAALVAQSPVGTVGGTSIANPGLVLPQASAIGHSLANGF